jgi:hypothetical protein
VAQIVYRFFFRQAPSHHNCISRVFFFTSSLQFYPWGVVLSSRIFSNRFRLKAGLQLFFRFYLFLGGIQLTCLGMLGGILVELGWLSTINHEYSGGTKSRLYTKWLISFTVKEIRFEIEKLIASGFGVLLGLPIRKLWIRFSPPKHRPDPANCVTSTPMVMFCRAIVLRIKWNYKGNGLAVFGN